VTQQCATPGCTTLTFGEVCLGCEQKKMKDAPRTFPRGRPYSRKNDATAVAPLESAAAPASSTTPVP
jgi:hypothetical protein